MSDSRWTKAQKLVLFVAWLGWTFDIMDAAVFNLAKQRMVTELLGGPEAYAAHGAATEANLLTVFLIAWSIGGVLFGWLSDRFGRAKVLAWTILLYSVATGATAFCHDLWQIMAVRFITGLGIGGEWSAGAAWVAETVPDTTRAKAASWLQSAAAVGPALAALANLGFRTFDWRVLFFVGAAPAIMTFWIRKSASESPASTQSSEPIDDSKPERLQWAVVVGALLLGTAGIATAQNVTFWLPNFVTSLSSGIDKAALQTRQSQATFSLHVGTLIGVFFVPWLCTKFGRKRTLLLCLVLSPILVALVSIVAKTYGLLLALAPVMSVFAIGIGAAFALYFPELFPRSFRATGAGLAYNGGRILAASFPILTAKLIQDSQGDVGKSVMQTSFVIAVGGLALLFMPETRGRELAA